MARTKTTASRLIPVARSDFKLRFIYPFNIKETLPQQKTIAIKKMVK